MWSLFGTRSGAGSSVALPASSSPPVPAGGGGDLPLANAPVDTMPTIPNPQIDLNHLKTLENEPRDEPKILDDDAHLECMSRLKEGQKPAEPQGPSDLKRLGHRAYGKKGADLT